ncbi:hypothetical protein GGR52DRAFT_441089 [Hypoxylon sp. FL1284]|nr:hypothetical protein GGR52DRAFT_441089 [Hypoxylon sp. FL1284]
MDHAYIPPLRAPSAIRQAWHESASTRNARPVDDSPPEADRLPTYAAPQPGYRVRGVPERQLSLAPAFRPDSASRAPEPRPDDFYMWRLAPLEENAAGRGLIDDRREHNFRPQYRHREDPSVPARGAAPSLYATAPAPYAAREDAAVLPPRPDHRPRSAAVIGGTAIGAAHLTTTSDRENQDPEDEPSEDDYIPLSTGSTSPAWDGAAPQPQAGFTHFGSPPPTRERDQGAPRPGAERILGVGDARVQPTVASVIYIDTESGDDDDSAREDPQRGQESARGNPAVVAPGLESGRLPTNTGAPRSALDEQAGPSQPAPAMSSRRRPRVPRRPRDARSEQQHSSRPREENWTETICRVATTTQRPIFVVEGDCHVSLSSPAAAADEPLVVHVQGDLRIVTAGPRKRKRGEEERRRDVGPGREEEDEKDQSIKRRRSSSAESGSEELTPSSAGSPYSFAA